MKLTPLGKLLLFLIGLGLVATAVYRFVPPDQLPWNRPKAAPGTEARPESKPAESPRPAADRPSERPAANHSNIQRQPAPPSDAHQRHPGQARKDKLELEVDQAGCNKGITLLVF